MNTQNPQQLPKQDIIFDTCLLQYLGNKNIANQLILYMGDLLKRKFGLAISEITIYELLAGSTIKKETGGIGILRLFKTFQVTQNVLIASSRLSTIYHNVKTTYDSSISIPDKIIASTAILTGSLVLTANLSDFPRPFFQEVEQKIISYTKKNKPEMLVTQILRPNYFVINKKLKDRQRG